MKIAYFSKTAQNHLTRAVSHGKIYVLFGKEIETGIVIDCHAESVAQPTYLVRGLNKTKKPAFALNKPMADFFMFCENFGEYC